MAITLLDPLSAGNAVRVYITPPPAAVTWRVLRRTADAFTDQADPGAVLVLDGDDNVVVDTVALVNGTSYFYKAYFLIARAWVASPSMQITPDATYGGDDVNPARILRDRLEAGLKIEVQRGALIAESGRIKVHTGPYQREETIQFPLMFVHQDSQTISDRFVGEDVVGSERDLDGSYFNGDGVLARFVLNLGVVARNLDEREAMRRALQRILLANLAVFAAAGIIMPEWTMTDSEDLQAQGAPLFMSGGQFTCVAVSWTGRRVPQIGSVVVTAGTFNMEPAAHG